MNRNNQHGTPNTANRSTHITHGNTPYARRAGYAPEYQNSRQYPAERNGGAGKAYDNPPYTYPMGYPGECQGSWRRPAESVRNAGKTIVQPAIGCPPGNPPERTLAPLPQRQPESVRNVSKPLVSPPVKFFSGNPPDLTPAPLPERTPAPSVWRELLSLCIKIAMIAAVAAVIFQFVYGLHYNVDPSMNPSVKDGDLVMYYRLDKGYRAGDLLLLTFRGQTQLRRVIATAGDTVDITEDGLRINGALQQEPGIRQKTQRYTEGIDFPVTLKEHEVFVLGDAREGATDSRVYGAVNIEDTQGKVITLLRRRSL